MMRLLHTLFSSATEPTSAVDALAAAKAERIGRVAALNEATAHIQRVEQVLAAAVEAEKQLESAEALASAASKAWAAGGAVGEPSNEAFAAASEARTRAHRLRLMADGAQAALRGLEQTAADAQAAVAVADERIRIAAVGVLVSEAEPHFENLEELMPKVSAALLALRGLRSMTSSKFNGFGSSSASAQIVARLAAHGFTAPSAAVADDEVDQASKEWLDRARELVR
jgi:hypothetical protein